MTVGRDVRAVGPQRFQEPVGGGESRSVGAGLGAALLLLLLVVGVPTGFVLIGAVPAVPTSLPQRVDLMATIGVEQVLAVLVWVVWLAWLQFAVCVLVELRSALRGVGLPARVPMAGPSQRLARTLVVSVLLLVTAAGQATAAVAPAHVADAPTLVSVSASVVPGAQEEALSVEVAPAAEAEAGAETETTYWLGGMQLSPQEGAELEGRRVYVVQPPEGRYHDNLWDIAERTLGDGFRYQEVFELNKGRPQPDGQELTLERLIQPQWLLVMPEDATTVERVAAVVTPVEQAAPVAPAAPIAGVALPQTPAVPADVPQSVASPVVGADEAPAAASTDASQLSGLAAAGLLAAGLVVALERRRRRGSAGAVSESAVEVEVALRVGADPRRALLLDRGLRRLAASVRAAGRELPGVVRARVDDASLELLLVPPRPDAPTPWRAEDGGRTWRLAASDVDVTRVEAAAPFPGLVSVGRDASGADVLLDLEAAQGAIALVGDRDAAVQVVTAWATELATNRWSDVLRVTGVGLPSALDVLPDERYAAVSDVTPLLGRLRERRSDVLGADVLTGRARAAGEGVWVPEYVVLADVPPGAAATQVVQLATTTARSPLGVVCAGDLPGARWQLHVTADGRLTAPLLGLDVQANRVSAQQAAALGELLSDSPEPAAALDLRAVREHEGGVERPPVELPERAAVAADLEAADVRVRVLGEPRVETGRPVEESRRVLLTELVVLVALHPEGVHANVLAAALWPGGVTPEVRDRTLARAATWLGSDAAGRPHLHQGADGRWRLGRGAVVDWDVVRTLLARSRSTSDPAAERAGLAEALRLASAPVVAVRPHGRYAWLARVRAERESRALLVDAAHRLVVLSWHDDDPTAAQAAAWTGVRIAPAAELLWRDVLRATAGVGGPEAVREVVDVLAVTLREAGVPAMSAATAALVEELLPDGPRAAPSAG